MSFNSLCSCFSSKITHYACLQPSPTSCTTPPECSYRWQTNISLIEKNRIFLSIFTSRRSIWVHTQYTSRRCKWPKKHVLPHTHKLQWFLQLTHGHFHKPFLEFSKARNEYSTNVLAYYHRKIKLFNMEITQNMPLATEVTGKCIVKSTVMHLKQRSTI